MSPQSLPWLAQDCGEQLPLPHTLAMPPPPHVLPAAHGPQSSVFPQPSEMTPQFLASAWQVVGIQPLLPAALVPALAAPVPLVPLAPPSPGPPPLLPELAPPNPPPPLVPELGTQRESRQVCPLLQSTSALHSSAQICARQISGAVQSELYEHGIPAESPELPASPVAGSSTPLELSSTESAQVAWVQV